MLWLIFTAAFHLDPTQVLYSRNLRGGYGSEFIYTCSYWVIYTCSYWVIYIYTCSYWVIYILV